MRFNLRNTKRVPPGFYKAVRRAGEAVSKKEAGEKLRGHLARAGIVGREIGSFLSEAPGPFVGGADSEVSDDELGSFARLMGERPHWMRALRAADDAEDNQPLGGAVGPGHGLLGARLRRKLAKVDDPNEADAGINYYFLGTATAGTGAGEHSVSLSDLPRFENARLYIKPDGAQTISLITEVKVGRRGKELDLGQGGVLADPANLGLLYSAAGNVPAVFPGIDVGDLVEKLEVTVVSSDKTSTFSVFVLGDLVE